MFLGARKHNLFLWPSLVTHFRVFFFFFWAQTWVLSLCFFFFPPFLIECFVTRVYQGFIVIRFYQGFIVMWVLGFHSCLGLLGFHRHFWVTSKHYRCPIFRPCPTVCALFISFQVKNGDKQFPLFPMCSHHICMGFSKGSSSCPLKMFPISPQIYCIWFAQSSILMYIIK